MGSLGDAKSVSLDKQQPAQTCVETQLQLVSAGEELPPLPNPRDTRPVHMLRD